MLRLGGQWRTEDGRRILVVDRVQPEAGSVQPKPMRIVLFLTDGYVGNDMAIIDAVRNNAHTTRVFSFGIGNSVNRYLLEGMARAGRGEAEFVLLNADADEAVKRFTRRVETPVLTDIEVSFSDELDVFDLLPSPIAMPDLFDAKPLVIHGRYRTPGAGAVTIRGRTGAGVYQRSFALDLPPQADGHDVIATIWARAKVEQVSAPHLNTIQEGQAPEPVRQELIALGERFQILTQFTSFVAVEKSRLTIEGKPVLVAVPIEMPEGVSYEGVFGEASLQDRLAVIAAARLTSREGFAMYSIDPANAGVPFQNRALDVRPTTGQSAPAAGPADSSANEFKVSNSPPPPPPASLGRGAKRDAPGKSGGFGGGGSTSDVRAGGKSPSDSGARGLPSADAPVNGAVLAGEPRRAPSPPARTEAESLGVELDEKSAVDHSTVRELKAVADQYGYEDRSKESLLKDEVRLDVADDLEEAAVIGQLAEIPMDDRFFRKRGQQTAPAVGRPIYAQHVAMVIGDRADEGRLEAAASLADALVRTRPDYEVGVQMRDALADVSLGEDGRRARIAVLAGQARQELTTALAELNRQARLNRVLDPALRAMTEGRPRVTVLVTKVDDETTRALTKAGLRIEAASKSLPIVVGLIDVPNLEKLALLDGVRRVEPTRM
jgi:hypothetical protein